MHKLSFAGVVLTGLGLVALTCSKQQAHKAWPAKEDACGIVLPPAATVRPGKDQ